MKLKMDPAFKKKAQGLFGKYTFEVGVLKDAPHREARRGARGLKGRDVMSSYAGGPVRKAGRASGISVAQVAKENAERLGVNWLIEPFKKKSSDIIKFTDQFFKLAFGKSEKKRCENLLQAVVRNPILRGEYGPQSELTTKIKGFDRPMIDTGQLFKSIKAVCKVK